MKIIKLLMINCRIIEIGNRKINMCLLIFDTLIGASQTSATLAIAMALILISWIAAPTGNLLDFICFILNVTIKYGLQVKKVARRYSLVVEHLPCKEKGGGSTPTIGFFKYTIIKTIHTIKRTESLSEYAFPYGFYALPSCY